MIPTLSNMWAFMSGDTKNFATSNKAGKDRVHKDDGKYAFLMESTSVEYIVERECELTQIGGLLDSKGYGIALPPSKNKLFYKLPLSNLPTWRLKELPQNIICSFFLKNLKV